MNFEVSHASKQARKGFRKLWKMSLENKEIEIRFSKIRQDVLFLHVIVF